MGKFGRKFRRQEEAKHGRLVRGPGGLNIYEVKAETDLAELEQAVVRLAPVVTSGGAVFLAVGGYDEDPRDIAEIPEVAEVLQRVIDSGLIALLGSNDQFDVPARQVPFIDRTRCYLLAKGGMLPVAGGGALGYGTPAIAEELQRTMEDAKRKVALLLERSKGGPNA